MIVQEPDVVTARQSAKQVARLLGFDAQDQVRFATATSEIARNALQYAGGGRLQMIVDTSPKLACLLVQVSDRGPGIADIESVLAGSYQSRTGMGLGLVGTQRLMERFSVRSSAQMGTTVTFGKALPLSGPALTPQGLASVSSQLAHKEAHTAYQELQLQNQELLGALDLVRRRETELGQRQQELRHLNQELEETNRGVVALYAELDEKANALRRADELKSRFLSHMSHEFRTPLNSILGLSALLRDRVDGELTPEQERQVGYIRKAAEELYDMVSDLLDLAKVEAGKTELHLSSVSLAELFGALRGVLRPLATNKAVSLIFEEPPPEMVIVTDEGKVTQILRNLISNALKFTLQGEVRVSAQWLSSPDTLELTVSDTGIGIAPEDRDTIFSEFSQIDSPTQRQVRGTGLGLPLSRKLAELLGGSLSVTSSVNIGSRFALSLPREWAVAAELPGEPGENPVGADPQQSLGRPGIILLIDDEELARYLTRHMLRRSRHRVIETASGPEGTERARLESPKLIVLDLTMPGQDGFSVLDELKSHPATAAIPVVIHSSRTLTPEEWHRLGGRQLAILPKSSAGREEAYQAMSRVLGEPHLFAAETSRSGE